MCDCDNKLLGPIEQHRNRPTNKLVRNVISEHYRLGLFGFRIPPEWVMEEWTEELLELGIIEKNI